MSKRIAYCTFGCRLNQYDTEAIRTLVRDGCDFEAVGPRDAADVYVVNTCSVTARADASARKAIRRIAADHPSSKIVVTGCYAQRAPGELAVLPGVCAGRRRSGSLPSRRSHQPSRRRSRGGGGVADFHREELSGCADHGDDGT